MNDEQKFLLGLVLDVLTQKRDNLDNYLDLFHQANYHESDLNDLCRRVLLDAITHSGFFVLSRHSYL